jgi:hypothetical protein
VFCRLAIPRVTSGMGRMQLILLYLALTTVVRDAYGRHRGIFLAVCG